MQTIKGKYTTERDDGIDYTYEVSWHASPTGALWEAKVRRDGDLHGTPSGQFMGLKGTEEGFRNIMRKWIESCIEDRVGVE